LNTVTSAAIRPPGESSVSRILHGLRSIKTAKDAEDANGFPEPAGIFPTANLARRKFAAMKTSGLTTAAKIGLGERTGNEFSFDARPHLFPLPQERISPVLLSLIRMIVRPIQSLLFQSDGERFSLSSEERAGVRSGVKHYFSGVCGQFVTAKDAEDANGSPRAQVRQRHCHRRSRA
jgi:hypothetical protein